MNRMTATLGLLFVLAPVSFCASLVALSWERDLLALLLAIFGALSLRALSLATTVAERGMG